MLLCRSYSYISWFIWWHCVIHTVMFYSSYNASWIMYTVYIFCKSKLFYTRHRISCLTSLLDSDIIYNTGMLVSCHYDEARTGLTTFMSIRRKEYWYSYLPWDIQCWQYGRLFFPSQNYQITYIHFYPLLRTPRRIM